MPDIPHPMPVGHRRHRTARQVIRQLLRRPGDHRSCWCAACDPAEVVARRSMHVPATHPEWVTRVLPEADEEYLARLAAELWPDEDYMEIIGEEWLRRRDDDGGGACTT